MLHPHVTASRYGAQVNKKAKSDCVWGNTEEKQKSNCWEKWGILCLVVMEGGGSRSQKVPRSHPHILKRTVRSEGVKMVTQNYFQFCFTQITSSRGNLMAGRIWLVATPIYNSTERQRNANTSTHSCL